MAGHRISVCTETAIDGNSVCYMGVGRQRQWDDPTVFRTYNAFVRDRLTIAMVGAGGTHTYPDIGFRVFFSENAWGVMKDRCLRRLQVPKTWPGPSIDPLMMIYTKEYTELAMRIPKLELLTNAITDGVRRANLEKRPLRVEFLIEADFDNPSWRQIAIKVHSLSDLGYDMAQVLWRGLEDEIRPSVERIIQENITKFKESPIEISNENVYIGFYDADHRPDRSKEERLMRIEDPFVREGERVFLTLPRKALEPYRHDFILLELETSKIIGGFKSRTEAHRFLVDSRLDPIRYYLRKVDLSPLMVF